jgi:hypothetical protein
MKDAVSDAPTVRDGWLVWEVPGKRVLNRFGGRLGLATGSGGCNPIETVA